MLCDQAREKAGIQVQDEEMVRCRAIVAAGRSSCSAGVRPNAQHSTRCMTQLRGRGALLWGDSRRGVLVYTGEYAYAAMRVAGEDAVSQEVSMDAQRSLQL